MKDLTYNTNISSDMTCQSEMKIASKKVSFCSSASTDSSKSINLSDCYVMKKTRLIRQKTKEEVEFLEEQFDLDPSWSRKTVQYCKEVLNLGTTQIYKWGFDKKLALERKQKKLSKRRGRKNAQSKKTRSTKNKNNRRRAGAKKASKASKNGRLSEVVKPQISQLDYNKEVSELVALYNSQCKSDNERMSDASGHNHKKEFDPQIKPQIEVAEEYNSHSKTHDSPSGEDLRDNLTSMPNTWLDELWDESFDPCQYLGSSSDILQDSIFLTDSDYRKLDSHANGINWL